MAPNALRTYKKETINEENMTVEEVDYKYRRQEHEQNIIYNTRMTAQAN